MKPQTVAVVVALFVLVVSGISGWPAAHAQSGSVAAHDYVGAERCGSCHEAEFKIWQGSLHARALEALPEKDRADPRCLTCHTMVVEDRGPALTGIQCETCHGPGRHYSIDYVMRDDDLRAQLGFAVPTEKTCLRCHTDTSPSLRPFTYAEKLEAIRHW